MRANNIALCAVFAAATASAARASSGFGYSATVTSVQSVSGVSSVNYTPASGDSYTADNVANTGTTIFLGRSTAFAGQNEPDAFNAAYTISLTINDYDSTSGTLAFHGQVTGYLNNRQASLVNTYADPYVQSITLGATTYTVTLLPWASPGPPVDSAMGALQAYVTAAPTARRVAGVSIPAGVKPGRAVQGTVTLDGPAPMGGATVSLVSAKPGVLAVQGSVFVPQGASSAPFFGSAALADAGAQVHANWNGTTASQTVPIAPGVCWDVDSNGVVNVLDAARLLRGAAGLDTLPPC